MPQEEVVLKPSLVMHLACGHLIGIAKEDNDAMLTLNKDCHEVCQLHLFFLLDVPSMASSIFRYLAALCA